MLTFLVLRGYTYSEIQLTAAYQHVAVWSFSVAVVIIPVVLHYGFGVETQVTDCSQSVEPDLFNYFFYIPLAICMAFAIYLLFYTGCIFSRFLGKARKRVYYWGNN